MIGSLAARVRELSLRVAQLEGDLEAARRRIAVYEDFDSQVQDSLSAALRAANQIRERAHVTAEAIAQEARALQPAQAQELAALRVERDTLRRAIDEAAALRASSADGLAGTAGGAASAAGRAARSAIGSVSVPVARRGRGRRADRRAPGGSTAHAAGGRSGSASPGAFDRGGG